MTLCSSFSQVSAMQSPSGYWRTGQHPDWLIEWHSHESIWQRLGSGHSNAGHRYDFRCANHGMERPWWHCFVHLAWALSPPPLAKPIPPIKAACGLPGACAVLEPPDVESHSPAHQELRNGLRQEAPIKGPPKRAAAMAADSLSCGRP